MPLKIGHKIYSVALIVLILMAIVAYYSINLTAKIAAELDFVSTKQLPLSETVGQINVHVLEQAVLIQRLFADHHDTAGTLDRILMLDGLIETEFSRAFALLEVETALDHHGETMGNIRESIETVEAEYRNYERQGIALLQLLAAQEIDSFQAQLPDFNKLQEAVDREIETLHRALETQAGDAVRRADENEQHLLITNTVLTILSGILGLGIAAIVTTVLVRNIRTLVAATAEIEQGKLDVEVALTTKDEVGRLGQSFNAMAEGLRTKELIKDTFGKYVDRRIVEGLLDDPEFASSAGKRCEMSIMFIDLQGYTTISENLPSQDLLRLLNLFLSRMTDAVATQRGVINDFQGDAVMSFWGPPFTGENDHAELACKAAMQALINFDEFKHQVADALGEDKSGVDLAIRIGIATGPVVAGNVGSEKSLKYTVIGDVVNLGARLEGANKAYGTTVMLSQRTRELLGSRAPARELDLIRVKGKNKPTRVFELSGPWPDRQPLDRALAAYRSQEWDNADRILNAMISAAPGDPVPVRFLERIAYLRANPPGPDWDGVWEFTTK